MNLLLVVYLYFYDDWCNSNICWPSCSHVRPTSRRIVLCAGLASASDASGYTSECPGSAILRRESKKSLCVENMCVQICNACAFCIGQCSECTSESTCNFCCCEVTMKFNAQLIYIGGCSGRTIANAVASLSASVEFITLAKWESRRRSCCGVYSMHRTSIWLECHTQAACKIEMLLTTRLWLSRFCELFSYFILLLFLCELLFCCVLFLLSFCLCISNIPTLLAHLFLISYNNSLNAKWKRAGREGEREVG